MPPNIWKLRDIEIDLEAPKIMGILNVTPDSFSDGGFFLQPEDAIHRARRMEEEGADILDIGAESTRPGAQPIDVEEEWKRLDPILKALAKQLKVPISIDTRHAVVAQRAIETGIQIINDVSCAGDLKLLNVVKQAHVGYILMHSRGEPANMMESSNYQDIVREVREEISLALERVFKAGISKEKICLDPGIGFAKTPQQNYHLLNRLDAFTSLDYPLLAGISRKRFLRELVGEDSELLKTASVVAGLCAVQRGAKILRVHDVALTKMALNVWNNIVRG